MNKKAIILNHSSNSVVLKKSFGCSSYSNELKRLKSLNDYLY